MITPEIIRVEKSIIMNVPTSAAFHYLKEPNHLPEFCPNVIEVNDVHHHPSGHTVFEWSYKMLGVHFEGSGELTELVHERHLEIRFWGGIIGKMTLHIQPTSEALLLSAEAEYQPPTPLLPKHPEPTIIRHNQRSLECMLTSLKTLLEARLERQGS